MLIIKVRLKASKLRKMVVMLTLMIMASLLQYLLLEKTANLIRILQGFTFSWIIVGTSYLTLLYLLRRVFTKGSKNNLLIQENDYSNFPIRRIILALTICIVLANLLVGLRYLNSFNPKGFDTPYYVYRVKEIYSGEFSPSLSYFLITLLLTPLAYIFKGDPFFIGVTIPFYIASIFTIITFISFLIMNKSLADSLFITICAVYNFFFIRLTYDLFSQALIISLFYLLIATFADSLLNDNRRNDHVSFLKAGIILTLIFLTNFALSLIIFGFFAILTFILALNMLKTGSKKIVTHRSKVPAIILLLMINIAFGVTYYLLFVLNVGNISNLYMQIITREISFLRARAGWEWIIYNENLPILVLCSLAVAYYIGRERIFLKSNCIFLLVAWSSYISSLIFITNYVQTYRLILFLPIATIAGNGISLLLKERIFQRTLLNFKSVQVAKSLSAGLAILLITTMYPLAEIPAYDYFPKNEEALSKLASYFGYNHKGVIYLIDKRKVTNVSPYWYQAYLGENVFIGNIGQLLARNITVSKIVIHEDLYPLDRILRSISEPIGDGIYIVNITYLKPMIEGD